MSLQHMKEISLYVADKFGQKKATDENAEFQKALAYVESLTTKGGKPVPADVNPMAVFVEEKYKL